MTARRACEAPVRTPSHRQDVPQESGRRAENLQGGPEAAFHPEGWDAEIWLARRPEFLKRLVRQFRCRVEREKVWKGRTTPGSGEREVIRNSLPPHPVRTSGERQVLAVEWQERLLGPAPGSATVEHRARRDNFCAVSNQPDGGEAAVRKQGRPTVMAGATVPDMGMSDPSLAARTLVRVDSLIIR